MRIKEKTINWQILKRKKLLVTHTLLSHHRRENDTQVYPLNDTEVNTTLKLEIMLVFQKITLLGLEKVIY